MGLEIRRVKLTNWMPFKGEHDVPVPGGVVLVTGERPGEGDRSNWSGKSAFLEAIDWVLYGGPGRFKWEDRLITRGQDVAEVEVFLSDGSVVKRRRRVASSSTVNVTHGTKLKDGQNEKFTGRTAAREIVELLGADHDAYQTAVHIRQGDAMALIRSTDSQRRAIVMGWLDAAPWQRALREAGTRMRGARTVRDEARGRVSSLDVVSERSSEAVEYLGHVEADESPADHARDVLDEIVSRARVARDELVTDEAEVRRLRESAQAENRAKNMAHRLATQEYARLVQDRLVTIRAGNDVRRLLAERAGARDEIPGVREACRSMAADEIPRVTNRIEELAAMGGAEDARQARVREVTHGWQASSGNCPFTGSECGDRPGVSAAMEIMTAELVPLSRRAERRARTRSGLRDRRNELNQERTRAQTARRRHTELLRVVAGSDPEVPEVPLVPEKPPEPELVPEPTGPTDPARCEDLRTLVCDLDDRAEVVRAEVARLLEEERREQRLEEARRDLSEAEHRVGVAALAERCLRSIAGPVATAQAKIETRVAHLLHGSTLEFRIRWSREIAKYSTVCSSCDHQFGPTSKRKSCPCCGATRTRAEEPFLALEVNDGSGWEDAREKSGAARILTAVSVRLAAAASNPAVRAGWRILDEGAGELDRFCAARFMDMVERSAQGEAGQVIMVSHDPDILARDSLPRIRVVRDGEWSRILS